MTQNEAIQFENDLKKCIFSKAEQKALNTEAVNKMIDDSIEIYPDHIDSMGMFHLGKMGETSKSVRPGNVMFNQKALLGALVDLALSVSAPDDWYSYVVLILAGMVFTKKMVTKEIDEIESYVVAYLHTNGMYDHGKLETDFYEAFPVWYEEKTGDNVSPIRLKNAMDNLYKMKSVEIVDGEIRLKERVWINHLA